MKFDLKNRYSQTPILQPSILWFTLVLESFCGWPTTSYFSKRPLIMEFPPIMESILCCWQRPQKRGLTVFGNFTPRSRNNGFCKYHSCAPISIFHSLMKLDLDLGPWSPNNWCRYLGLCYFKLFYNRKSPIWFQDNDAKKLVFDNLISGFNDRFCRT